ncbi:hypothetical protein HHL21_10095 [Massilia sp. RP-1-19]|uniref:Uncharacterized protein n=1 Tax=Massilia polaris TaxID=2728846 RepID=A0A848HJX8_9BURK|nr:hypothetical protein [Massilia polaris]NML61422.1 hypothetical protein [Massilia polaris]
MSKFELRLSALSKLVDVKSPAVEERLSEEFGRISEVLQESCEYDELSEALKTLEVLVPRFHMATLPTLESFVKSVQTRTLTEGGAPITGAKLRYRSPEILIRESIEVADKVRYVHTELLVDFLLQMSRDDDKEVRAKAERSLETLASIDLHVFYGPPPRGAESQARLVTHLTQLTDDALRTNADIVLRILGTILSPTIEGTNWTFQSVTIRRGSVTSDGGVADMRADAIKLAKRMYGLVASVDHQKHVLRTLDSATRREVPSSDAGTSAMFERDTVTVLDFMRELVMTSALPLVQLIEHDAYWDYYRGASETIKRKALDVRDVVDAHAEYQIYKQLIGFEGIFGNWEDLSRSDEAWEYGDTKRLEAARQYLHEIDDASYEKWRDRILDFSKTRSNDLASFPVYYQFLESIGRERPRLALELVAVHEVLMAPFLIPLLRGLWGSVRSVEIEAIVENWLENGRHLIPIAKSLYQMAPPRLDILLEVTARASALSDRDALIEVMAVAASLYAKGAEDAKSLFMQSLRELKKHNDSRWVRAIWFNRDLRVLVSAMEPHERAELLASLATLPELDYQAEDVLYEMAQHDLHAVLDFLIGRLTHARVLDNQKRVPTGGSSYRFEAIPYQLNKLNKVLAREPDALLLALRGTFDKENQSFFSYRGARLVKSAFPLIGEPLEQLLLKYVVAGTEDDIKFVIGVLRAYEGDPSILEVCKAIIRTVPERSPIWNEVAAAIETTGVVSGEYGMVEAFERKQHEISGWTHDEDSHVQAFSRWLTESLQRMIKLETERAGEGMALRKYRYGVGKDKS